MQPRWKWQRLSQLGALLGLVLLTGLGATSLCARALEGPLGMGAAPPSIVGLRLGATPDMVRDRFAGVLFRTELGEDVALVTDMPLAPGIEPGARFEFHDGQLVAVRLLLASEHPDAPGDRLVATPGTVLSRTPEADGRVRAILLSRTCPTHRDEAERLAPSTRNSESQGLP